MESLRKTTSVETAILVVGIVQLALVPCLTTFGGRADHDRALQMLSLWALGVLLTGLSISRGRQLNWRHFMAIVPGLACVYALPKVGAISVLIVLGAILLRRARVVASTGCDAHQSV
jgi:hypothetical protein